MEGGGVVVEGEFGGIGMVLGKKRRGGGGRARNIGER